MSDKKTYVRPHKRKNPKSSGEHHVKGHTRRVNSIRGSIDGFHGGLKGGSRNEELERRLQQIADENDVDLDIRDSLEDNLSMDMVSLDKLGQSLQDDYDIPVKLLIHGNYFDVFYLKERDDGYYEPRINSIYTRESDGETFVEDEQYTPKSMDRRRTRFTEEEGRDVIMSVGD